MKKNQLIDFFSLTTTIIKLRQSFEIGSLNQICKILQQDPSLLETTLQNCFLQFLNIIGDFSRKNNQSKAQSIALIVLQSIMFNLYAKNKKTDKMKLNNSFYRSMSNSMSMSMSLSQMSMDLSQQSIISPQDMKKLTNFLQSLTNNKKFFKRLSVIKQRHNNKSRNQKYLQNFLQTMQYIMNKQKMNKDNYYQAKKAFSTAIISKQQIKDNWQIVNQIIFSNKLNRITFMLTDASDQVYFALNRIYFLGKKNQDRRHFRNNKYNAQDMFFNIYKLYINSFANKMEIFQEGKHPIYRFITCYFQCFFMPEFLKFNQIIQKASKNQFDGNYQFYKSAQSTVVRDLIAFIDEMPAQLIQYLNLFFRIIQAKFGTGIQNQGSTCLPIKKLFLYSFLVKTDFIQELFQQTIDLDKYQDTCNNILNLFFPSSIKNFSQQMIGTVQKLIQKVSSRIDQRIANPMIEHLYQDNGVSSYFIQQPILNHDYEILASWIKQLQFTPKDMKQFQMSKQTQSLQLQLNLNLNQQQNKSSVLQSPMMKQIKQNIFTENHQDYQNQQQNSTDLLTYMTVGGNHDWKMQTEQNTKKKKLLSDKEDKKRQKLKFQSFKSDKLKEVNRLYQEFKNIQLNLK